MAGPEKKIQTAVVEWSRREFKGKMIARRFQAGTYGTNGWPDYEFLISTTPFVFHIEFKAPGGDCTPLQLQRHAELRAINHKVFVVDSADQGKQIIRDIMGRVQDAKRLRGGPRAVGV